MSTPTPEFTITHTSAAPLERVWQAWTDPKLFEQWFGPKGWSCMVKTFDLRPGGILHSRLTTPDGQDMWAKFIYREVKPPEKLSWEHSFSDKDGSITRHPSHPVWPLKLITTIIFEAAGSSTKLTLTWVPFNASTEECACFESQRQSMTQGWGGTFEQLDMFLKMQKNT